MPSVDLRLDLSLAQCQHYYGGSAEVIHARALDGRRVQFPARALHRIIQRDGVHGVFRLHFSDSGRFITIEALTASA
ncbi:DUF2835 family protein [Salinicola rhizosphaerae]|uniref:DUF2835 family protein n=1 Tax=Salinicola rhizosphaerae TaxID=1443141 RepID=A0ABQ3DW18_9GAMM|nr:DUF2835 family protein [Salinicola rhizosphaerae]GHB18064.1 hypothetical protein GCM10009038_16330 [Salinicola rhizosphaerae]